MKWEFHTLDSLCDVRDGTHDSPKYVSEGYPLVTSKNVRDGRLDLSDVNFISEQDYKEINKRSKVDKGDIIMPMIGTIGNPIIVEDEPQFAIKNVCLIKKSATLDMKYVLYTLKSGLFEGLLNRSRGGTQKFISLGDIRKFKIPTPPLHIQRQIADALDKADALRKKDQQLLQKYDKLAQAIFYDMFGDPVKNERGWKEVEMKKVCNFSQGVQIPLENQSALWSPGLKRFLRISDYTAIVEPRYVNVSDEKSWVNKDDIVMVRYGASAGFIGYGIEGILANNLFKLNHDREKVTSLYLYYLLSSEYFKSFIQKVAFGAAMPALSFKVFEGYTIQLPPLSIQQKFCSKITLVSELSKKADLTAINTNHLFRQTLNNYFG